jgi:hypothetical protein
MKTISFIITVLLFTISSFAQDLTYDGPGKSEVHSFWINAMGIKKTGKIEEGIIVMEAKLALVKQKVPNYNTADMVEEIKKWKDKLAVKANTGTPTVVTPQTGVAVPSNLMDIKNMAFTIPDPGYAGPAKTFVTNYYSSASEAKENIIERKFTGAESKIRQMENALKGIKMKDPAYNAGALDAEINNFKTAMETEKYNIGKEKESKNNNAANEDAAGKVLKEIFGMDNLDFRTDQFPLRAMIVQKHKASLQTYLSLGAKASASALEGYRKKNDMFFLTHTNTTLKKFENFLPTAKGTDWIEGIYYSLQYHQSFWDAAQKIYPQETDFAAMYQKVTAFVNKAGSMENMKGKGNANNTEYIKNTKLPAAVVKDVKLEKILTDGFNSKYGASNKVSALKAVLTQDGWTTLRNSISGAVTGRERTAKVAYKGSDGKCYVLTDYVFIREEYIGSSFTNTKAIFNWLDGKEMLCENVK